MAELIIKKASKKLKEAKESKLNQIKQNANKVIEGRFPYYHRENLREGIKPDIPDLWNSNRVNDINVVNQFISKVIDTSNQVEQEIENAAVETIDSIDVSEERITEMVKEW